MPELTRHNRTQHKINSKDIAKRRDRYGEEENRDGISRVREADLYKFGGVKS
jgi:hypothetical protein